MRWLDQFFCRLFTGHTYIATFDSQTRGVTWVCTSCLAKKDGWIVDGNGPRKRFDGDRTRHQLRRVN